MCIVYCVKLSVVYCILCRCVYCVVCILLFIYIVKFSYLVACTTMAQSLVAKNFTISTLVYMMCVTIKRFDLI